MEGDARRLLHDLKEPLHTAQGFLDLLHERADGLGPEARECLEGARRGLAAALERVQAGLAGGAVLRPAWVDAGVVMEAVTADLGAAIRAQDATVTWRRLPTVWADVGALRRILQNLVGNAIRHGGVGVHVEVRGRPTAAGWTLVVSDDGHGIPADRRPQLFREATQGARGIGLASARLLARAHGGDLAFEPLPHGASFILRIPQAPLPTRAADKGS